MRVHRDPDLVLVEEMLAPPPLDDARSSLEYWQRRGKALPLYRRGARRKAREMAIYWHEQVRAAERVRFDSSLLGRLLIAVGISTLWVQRVRFTKAGLFSLAWAFVPRKLKFIAAGVAAASLIVMLAA